MIMKTRLTHARRGHTLRRWPLIILGLLPVLGGGFVANAVAQDDPKPDPAAVARGAQAWEQQCNRCHNRRDINELTDAEWDVSVAHMRLIGNLPGEMARDIAAFLKASN
jgi:mono/diheme cytochrome c family protein